jgi:hypothetical protein
MLYLLRPVLPLSPVMKQRILTRAKQENRLLRPYVRKVRSEVICRSA